MRRSSRKPQRVAGFTLLEVAIYVTVLAIVGGPFVTLVLTSTRSTAENDTFNRVESVNRSTLFRISRDVRRSISTTATIGDSGLSLTVTLPAGFDGTSVIPGQQIRYTFRSRADDPSNGADDNKNGVVDEGELVRRNLTTASEQTVASGFDLDASGFSMSGSEVNITVSSIGSLDRRYGTYSVTNSVSVVPRN